ncbi:thiol-disulfide oxidoreductase DCC family protein [Sphaerisporangium sp. NPDC049003]|uniref:thiol-disulfide oxidoreductase DCC family protein n=1 Tax=Sphaerisporangium sp. NPDC049003 TaxID=3364517 RepID=UPI00371A4EFD
MAVWENRHVLVYDGDCGFCQRCVEFGFRHLPVMPRVSRWQDLDLVGHGLTLDEVTRSVQLVGPNGLRASGARAVALLLAVQPVAWWRAAGQILLVPPVSWAAEVVYRVIARNRHRLPGSTGSCAVDR